VSAILLPPRSRADAGAATTRQVPLTQDQLVTLARLPGFTLFP
jgi:hypothetical protein